MRFTGVTPHSWFLRYALSSLVVFALAGQSFADPHASMHGDSGYSDRYHSGHGGSEHMGMSAHGDIRHGQEYGHKSGHMNMGHGGYGSRHSGRHQGATKFIDHILKFKEGMSLTPDQEQKLRDIKTQYQKDRIRKKADIQLANIDLHELLRNEHASLTEIENQLKNVHALKADLYMASIKAKRDAKGVLTKEQQSRMDKIHERIKSHGGNMAHAEGYSHGEKSKGHY